MQCIIKSKPIVQPILSAEMTERRLSVENVYACTVAYVQALALFPVFIDTNFFLFLFIFV